MSEMANTHCESFTPSAYQKARQRMHAFVGEPGDNTPKLFYDRLYLNPHLAFDWKRLVLECPGVAQSIRLSARENNGEVVLPPAVYHDLLERGLLVWIDDKEPS